MKTRRKLNQLEIFRKHNVFVQNKTHLNKPFEVVVDETCSVVEAELVVTVDEEATLVVVGFGVLVDESEIELLEATLVDEISVIAVVDDDELNDTIVDDELISLDIVDKIDDVV